MFEFSNYAAESIGEWNDRLMRRGIFADGGTGTGSDDSDDDDDDSDDDEADSGKTGKSKERTFSQAEFDAALKKRLGRETRKLTGTLTESIKAQLKQEMETAEAEKKGDLQKIIDDLKPKAAKVTDLEKTLGLFEDLSHARFDEAIEQLPDHIKAFAPDDDAPALEKERWLITKAMPAMKKLKKRSKADDTEDDEDDAETETKTRKRRGISPFDPDPSGKSRKKTVEEIIKGYEGSGNYRPL